MTKVNKQTNKQAEVACADVQMQGVVWSCVACRVQGGDCGDGVNPLGQVIHHHEDSIVSLGVWEFSDHVYRDHLPASIRDLVGDQLPHLLHWEGLRLVARCRQDNDML